MLSADDKKILADDFSDLDQVESGLAERALAYIDTGEPEQVLARLRADNLGAAALGDHIHLGGAGRTIKPTPRPQGRPRRILYERLGKLDPVVVYRLGKLVAAAFEGAKLQCVLPLPAESKWIEAFIVDLCDCARRMTNSWTSGGRSSPPTAISMALLEHLLDLDGSPASSLALAPFVVDDSVPLRRYSGGDADAAIRKFLDFSEAVIRHSEVIRPSLHPKSAQQRLLVANVLAGLNNDAVLKFGSEIADLAVDSSAQVRAVANTIGVRVPAAVEERLQAIATEGSAEARGHAVELLWRIGTETARTFVRSRAGQEKAPTVVKLIERLCESGESVSFDPPPLPTVSDAPMSEATHQIYLAMIRTGNAERAAMKARASAQQPWLQNIKLISDAEAEAGWTFLRDWRAGQPLTTVNVLGSFGWGDKGIRTLLPLFAAKDFGPVPFVRFIVLCGHYRRDLGGELFWNGPILAGFLREKPELTVLDIQSATNFLGVSDVSLVKSFFSIRPFRQISLGRWSRDFFLHNSSFIDAALDPAHAANRDYVFSRERLFEAIGEVPELQQKFKDRLFDLALGGGKSDRALAQAALENFAGKEDRIIEALADGKADVRAAAAQWLGRLKAKEAVGPLGKALSKEKNDLAASAMMTALERLDVPPESFLDRKKLLDDARKGVAKGIPTDLTWFPVAHLPALEWKDTGKAIEPDIVLWFLIQSFKLKSPEPGGVLRQYCARIASPGRERLGLLVLDAWLKQDIIPSPRDEAEKRAQAEAQTWFQMIQRSPQYFKDSPMAGKTVEQIFAQLLPRHLVQPAGSAIASKGILAIAAACGDADVVGPAGRYIKEWYGTRAGQGKALIQMLAWVEHPTAIQLMLAIGARFRTKGFQEEASRQAELLAERKGWTLDELADRTIPTAGFDENCEMELDYGERKFTARLDEEFRIALFNPEGKAISGLPDPRQSEDAALAAAAKKSLSQARKELKSVLQLQKDRLYEALCVERGWQPEEWETYLNKHPIVRRYCQRLVWRATGGGKPEATFRPLDDGTLTDLEDKEFVPAPGQRLSVAHDSKVDAETAKRWLKHFDDYGIVPLFRQFGGHTLALSESQKKASELEEFKGHLIEAFKLRGRLTKLGYTKGPAEDGGWFFKYCKRFPTLGLEAEIAFSGSPQPEENRTVALTDLTFQRGGATMRLGDVPGVLLSECWNDMRTAAAEGTGFDPAWESKVQM